jgi:citronellol/citronellal dehydrogenase
MMSLEGKVAIVTGSSRGIGKAIALALAEEGVDIVAAARTTDANPVSLPGTVDTTAAEVRALGRRAIGVRMDLTKEEDIEEMMRKTLEEFGRVDILVNNAGISFNGTILELPVKRWDLVMNVNLRGAYLKEWQHPEHFVSGLKRSGRPCLLRCFQSSYGASHRGLGG